MKDLDFISLSYYDHYIDKKEKSLLANIFSNNDL